MFGFFKVIDGEIVSPFSKESPTMEEKGKMGFLEEGEGVILKKNPTIQNPRHTMKEMAQKKVKKRERKSQKTCSLGC